MSIETVIQGRFDFADKSPDTPDIPRHSSQAPETYDASNDVMICPAGRILTADDRNIDKGGRRFTRYRCHDLANCPYADLCTRSKKARTIKRYVGDDAKTPAMAVNGSKNAGLMTILLNYMFLRLNFRKKTIFTKRCCQISFFSVV